MRPDANLWLRAECTVGHLENDPEHVQVLEEIDTRKYEAMQEADQVEEKGVAAEPCEETIVAIGRYHRFRAERHRRVVNNVLIIFVSAVRSIGMSEALDVRELVPVFLLRESDRELDIGLRVRVVVDQQLITRVMSKFIGMYWSQRIDVENENRFVDIAWLLEGVNVGDVHTSVHRRRCQVRRIEMVGHASPCLSSGSRSQLPTPATRVSRVRGRTAVTVAALCPGRHRAFAP